MDNKRKFNDYYYGLSKKGKKEVEELENDDENPFASLLKNSKPVKAEKIEKYDNHVYFYSEVSRESIFDLNMLLKEVEEENIITANKLNIDPIPIYLHINSYGGSVFAGFAAIDMIISCKVPVYTIIEGCAASAATMMSIVGAKRFIRPNSYMLVHQLSSGCWGKMNEIEDEYENLKELMKNIKSIYEKYAKIPKKDLTDVLKHDLWWNPEKCMSYGLVDELWKKL
jgi:ATP-dependent Clp endopeptidase proteolytic subunit ClpP